jgi:hypothetical protein
VVPGFVFFYIPIQQKAWHGRKEADGSCTNPGCHIGFLLHFLLKKELGNLKGEHLSRRKWAQGLLKTVIET